MIIIRGKQHDKNNAIVTISEFFKILFYIVFIHSLVINYESSILGLQKKTLAKRWHAVIKILNDPVSCKLRMHFFV